MTEADAIRFLEHEASFCRSHDDHEALCLLLPPLLNALRLPRMDSHEAQAFRRQLKEELSKPKKEAAHCAPQNSI